VGEPHDLRVESARTGRATGRVSDGASVAGEARFAGESEHANGSGEAEYGAWHPDRRTDRCARGSIIEINVQGI
jgi:hypothetical protein